MPVPDSQYSTLDNIRTKIRRLVRAPSPNQLSDQDIDNYVNNFVLYDFPAHLRLFSLRTVFTFWTSPFQDVYQTTTDDADQTNPFYNFQNKYISVHPPVYIAGYLSFYSQSREQFFGVYPRINTISQIGAGDGATVAFNGFIAGLPNTGQNACLLRNNVLFDSIDINGNSLTLVDDPQNATIGNLIIPNDPSTGNAYGTINYVTGQYTVTFINPPAAGATVNSQVVMQLCSLPQALMYYDNQFTVRPVPDQAYQVNIEAYIRPTELLAGTDEPTIAQWWQFIAYGGAKKIFEDRMDMDSVSMILPEYKKQELLVLRTTISQITNERTATIYTEQVGGATGGNGWGWGGGLF